LTRADALEATAEFDRKEREAVSRGDVHAVETGGQLRGSLQPEAASGCQYRDGQQQVERGETRHAGYTTTLASLPGT